MKANKSMIQKRLNVKNQVFFKAISCRLPIFIVDFEWRRNMSKSFIKANVIEH